MLFFLVVALHFPVSETKDYCFCLADAGGILTNDDDCYLEAEIGLNYAASKTACEPGGQVAILPDESIRAEVAAKFLTGSGKAWLRLEQEQNSAQMITGWHWVFPNGTKVPFGVFNIGTGPWNTNQPDDWPGAGETNSQNYALLLANGMIKDETPNEIDIHTICQYPKPVVPQTCATFIIEPNLMLIETDGAIQVSNPQACGELCLQKDGCKAIQFDTDNGTCLLATETPVDSPGLFQPNTESVLLYVIK